LAPILAAIPAAGILLAGCGSTRRVTVPGPVRTITATATRTVPGPERTVYRMKIQLVGSEKVSEVAEKLTIEASVAMTNAKADRDGKALNAWDNIRHTLYYLTDLMRSELTSNKEAVREWHRRPPRRLRRRCCRPSSRPPTPSPAGT
jgi:hypothetical protein